jgi:hypothetical protein
MSQLDRPRTSTKGRYKDPTIADGSRAARGRLREPEVLPQTHAAMPSPRSSWRPDTKAAYRIYVKSQSARALRPEDAPAVTRLWDYIDRRSSFWETVPTDATANRCHEALMVVAKLESMIQALALSIGLGPRARRDLPQAAPVISRLDAFRMAGDEPTEDTP